jgi:diguanylate cyclase (GGDEF)-like protein/PAS domain S-box-containing protein
MQTRPFHWRSLKTRVALFTFAISVLSIWLLSFYASRTLQDDMQRMLGEQQFSTASFVAAQVTEDLGDRLAALELIAKQIDPATMGDTASLQVQLEQRPILQVLFNGGTWVADPKGTVIADVPLSAQRLGVSYLDRDFSASVLKDGKPAIGSPVMGKKLNTPVFSIAVPIRDAQGQVTGVLTGVTDLGRPNFLDKITKNRYGKTGGYFLIDPLHKLFVTATDKGRIMQAVPAAGQNTMHDQYMQGFEGFGVAVNSRGVLELTAAKGVPVAGWFVVATLPIREAFAPIDAMLQRILLGALLLTLLAGALTWWVITRLLQHQLAPMLAATRTLAALADNPEPVTALPVAREDEIGELIGGFNRLLQTLRQREAKLELAASVFTHAREGIMITDPAGRIMEVNEAFTRITGFTSSEVLGQNPRLLGSGRHDAAYFETMWATLNKQGHWYGEIWNRRKNGDVFAELQTISAVRDTTGAVQHYVSLFSDITDQKAHESELDRMAHFDALTGLPNRLLLADRLQQGMAQAARRGQTLAVAYLDLDGFKAINDTQGHAVGDQLLISLAQQMKQALREGDTMARISGDEFVAVLPDLTDVADCTPLLNRLLAAASHPLQVGNLSLRVSASLGVSFYPQAQEVEADQLLRQADQAMYQAKVAGKNRYHVFDSAHDSSLRGHHESLERIRQALAAQEFVLYYQPKVNMRTGQVVGAEALIRWQHPSKGLLAPGQFLPVIEDDPLAIAVGEWVIDTALGQVVRWRAAGLEMPVSVNVGARQLQHPDFVARLRHILALHPQVSPQSLELELLETSALQDISQVSQVIEDCAQFGVMCALDDFGTGYSSLTYLKRLRVALLKIDQSFVRDMLVDPDDLAILQGVIGLAEAFKREVIAEGVETAAHGALLLQLGCDLAQGYGIARPMPADELPQWVATWVPDDSWTELPWLGGASA